MDKALLNFAYILLLLALLVRDVLWLRAIMLVSSLSFITYAFTTQNFSMTIWNTVFIAINVYHVIRIMRERRPVVLAPELEELFQQVFRTMSRREFLSLWNLGRPGEVTDQFLIREGIAQTDLTLITEGTVRVLRGGEEIARLGKGQFIAEMSFLTGEPASADVMANDTVRYVAWDCEKLAALQKFNPDSFIKIHGILGGELSRKLRRTSAASNSR